MNLFILKFFASLTILSTTLIAGLLPFYLRNTEEKTSSLGLGEALAAGVFLGAALFHMLPRAEVDFQTALGNAIYPYADLLCAAGFISLLFLEKMILRLSKNHFSNPRTVIAYVLIVVLGVHALTEGAALGINNNLASAIVLFIAIVIHKGSESFALATQLQRNNLTPTKIIFIFALFSLMTPGGIAAGTAIVSLLKTQRGMMTQAIFNALAAGTFLYIATLHQLNHQDNREEKNHLGKFTAMLCGLGVMAAVAIWV